MPRGRALVGIALTVLLILPFSACASKVRLSAKRMCEAHGGTYSAEGQHCDYTAQRRTAKQICEDHGGWYQAELQYCEIEAAP